MEKIAIKLMEFGMDFQYENNGSMGEKIESFTLGLTVTTKGGKIHFSNLGENRVFDDNENSMDKVLFLVDQACIEETT